MLSVAFDDWGPADGPPVVLLHGFPYDAHAYDDVVPLLVVGAPADQRPDGRVVRRRQRRVAGVQ